MRSRDRFHVAALERAEAVLKQSEERFLSLFETPHPLRRLSGPAHAT